MTARRFALVSSSLALLTFVLWTSRDHHATAGDTAATGSIVGTVAFKGTPPKRTQLKRDIDPVCAATEKLSEDVVITDGKLRDVHVRIPFGVAGSHPTPSKPVSVVQHECMYEPRLVGVQVGQDVVIKNGDLTYHNVRGVQGKRTLWNLSQPAKAKPLVRKNLGKAGDVVSLHCDVHPWMRAYAVVSDHPFFDVTDTSGGFTIDHVPAGTYELEAWHPTLGLQKTKVVVKAGARSEAAFQF